MSPDKDREQAGGPEPVRAAFPDPPAPTDGMLDQASIDALLALEREEARELGIVSPDDAFLSEPRLDEPFIAKLPLVEAVPETLGLENVLEQALSSTSEESAVLPVDTDALLSDSGIDDRVPPRPVRSHGPVKDAPPPLIGAKESDSEILDSKALEELLAETPSEDGGKLAESAAPDPEALEALISASEEEAEDSGGAIPAEPPLLLDQAALDELLAQASANAEALTSAAEPPPARETPEAIAAPPPAPEPAPTGEETAGETLLDQSAIDALIGATLTSTEPPAPAPKSAATEKPAKEVDIDALIASLGGESATNKPPREPGGKEDLVEKVAAAADEKENPAALVRAEKRHSEPAPAAQEEGFLSQYDLDALIAQAQQEQASPALDRAPSAAQSAPTSSETPEQAPMIREKRERRTKPAREPGPLARFVRRRFFQLAVSSAAGLVAALATFAYLQTHRERTLSLPAFQALQRVAEQNQAAPPGTQASPADAEFVELAKRYQALPQNAGAREIQPVFDAINDYINRTPYSPHLTQSLRWKADLYRREGALFAAHDVLRQSILEHPDSPDLDETLRNAAQVALDMGRPEYAVRYAQQELTRVSATDSADSAKLLLADAYAAAGTTDDAKALYGEIARSRARQPLAATAELRLAELAIRQGRPGEAVDLLERRLKEATTIAPNDRAHLLLARAYRAAGRLEDARRTLNELIDFFPESSVSPEAFIELMQTLEAMGLKREALQVARQTAERFPNNAAALEAAAGAEERDGNLRESAEILLEANRAGATDPRVLLAAARHFRDSSALPESIQAYKRVIDEFPDAPEALDAQLEMARAYFDAGQVREAVGRLRNLATAAAQTPKRLPVLAALGDMYRELGLEDRAAETFREIVKLTSEPDMLAQAAIALFDVQAWDEALPIARRVDVSRVADKHAYDLLMRFGKTMLRSDPRQGIALMERAYRSYSRERKPNDYFALFDAYLAMDNRVNAAAMVRDLEALAEKQTVEAPLLERAAREWGDYLYRNGEFQQAGDAYGTAIGAATPESPDLPWTKLQRANALIRTRRFVEALELFDEVAASDTPWAGDAAIGAEYARAQQRFVLTPVATTQAAASTAGKG